MQLRPEGLGGVCFSFLSLFNCDLALFFFFFYTSSLFNQCNDFGGRTKEELHFGHSTETVHSQG